MTVVKYPYPNPLYHGRHAIANSAGLIDIQLNQFISYEQALSAAASEAHAGYNGECWPVLIVPMPGQNTKGVVK